MSQSTVTSRGQTTLPKDVRRALALTPGDQLRYVILDDGQVRILRTRPVSDLAGILRRDGQVPVSLADMDAAIAAGAQDEELVTGLDTNVLVRYLVQDDRAQAAMATQAISALTEEMPGWIAREVLVETVWVLERAYRLSRTDIANAIDGLLAARELVVEEADRVGLAAQRWRDGGAGFSDQMIALAGQAAGCDKTLTFDVKAAKIAGMAILSEHFGD